MPLAQLSIMLDRTSASIRKFACQLGIEHDTATKIVRIVPGSKSKTGKRDDLGIACRSSWEANVLRVLTARRITWQYEPTTFRFENEKRGATTYTPDVYLPDLDLYLEIKGHLDSTGRSKIRKFAKFYPAEFAKLQAIPGTNKSAAAKWFASFGVPAFAFYNVLRFDYATILPQWEHDETSARWATSKRKRKRPDDTPYILNKVKEQPKKPKRRSRTR